MRKPLSIVLIGVMAALGCAGCDGTFPGAGASGSDLGEKDFTIGLMIFRGSDHVREAQFYQAQTEKVTGWKDLVLVHKAGQSELYKGRYYSPEAAQKDLKAVRTMKTPTGVMPYATAMVVPAVGNDPGPAKWNLKNSTGVCSVVVAVFFDVPEADYFGRKKIAVAYCEQLRQDGEEAYFYHGPAQSAVSIGSFPASSIKENPRAVLSEKDDASSGPVKAGTVYDEDVVDPRINEILRKHPYLAFNGRKKTVIAPDAKTQKAVVMDVLSYVFRIPRDGGALAAPSPQANQPARVAPPAVAPRPADAGAAAAPRTSGLPARTSP